MINRLDEWISSTVTTPALCLLARLAAVLLATTLKTSMSVQRGRFHAASIECGSYRIRVSPIRPSSSNKSRAKPLAVPHFTFTAEPKARAASSSKKPKEAASQPSLLSDMSASGSLSDTGAEMSAALL